MRSPKRTLVAWDGQSLSQQKLDTLLRASSECDELILALLQAEQGFTEQQALTGGQRIERLSALLRSQIERPLYLLPLKTHHLSVAQVALRLRFDVPSFDQLLTWEPELERAAASLLGCATQRLEPGDGPDLLGPAAPSRRGLFITRAQPFHLGHAACVQKIAEEMDEVIVLVALAESSHSLRNPATAGERLAMIGPYLERALPGRYHLAAAPYEPHTACNVGELQLLLPRFERIYSNSPSTRVLAESAGVECHPVIPNLELSASQVRQALLEGRALGELVPPEVESVISRIDLGARIQLLASDEVRWED